MNFNPDSLAKLAKLSDEELIAELSKQIKAKRADGTLGELEKMVRVITPFLSAEQKARLAKVIQAAQAQSE